jgi:hypothetical protein
MSLHFGPAPGTIVPLIPRRTFFRNPDRANVQLSSDGAQLAWTEPVAGIQNVFVAPLNDIGRARQVTRETRRSISGYLWAYTNVTSSSCATATETRTTAVIAWISTLARSWR